LIALAVGGLIVTAGVWWLSARDPLQAAGARVAPAPIAAPSTAPGAARSTAAALPPPPAAPYPAAGSPGLSTDDPLTAYRKANVYPPTSRPLTADQVDLLHPGQRHETMRPDDHGAGITYRFTADRYFVIGDETLTATLDVRRNGAPIPVAITQAYAVVVDPTVDSAPRPAGGAVGVPTPGLAALAPDGDADLPDDLVEGFTVVGCEACGGTMMPDVVFFGGSVPRATLDAAWAMFDRAEALLVIGSSLTVFSGFRFVRRAAERGVPIGILNRGPTRGDDHAAVRLDARAGAALPALARAL
jgi:hypothetical protein